MSVAVVGVGALSGHGRGEDAFGPHPVGEPAWVSVRGDDELEAVGLTRPFASRVAVDGGPDRLTALVRTAWDDCFRAFERSLGEPARARWRSMRIGLAVGTSSGGMRSAVAAFDRVARGESLPRTLADRATYFAPFEDLVVHTGLSFVRASMVLGACASATLAIGLGKRWLEADGCDVVFAGGFDEVTPFVAAGFEVLRATSARVPSRPFRASRDGMALGEGAAFVALVRAEELGAFGIRHVAAGSEPSTVFFVDGFGAASDAVHLTAPDRTGDGLRRAGARAVADASVAPRELGLVSVHGTATPYNDAAESKAIHALLGEAAARTPIHAMKAQIGHTLGAAGVLETLGAAHCLARGVVPATPGEGELDADAPALVLARSEPREIRHVLKLSAAFGGANAALVLGPVRDVPPADPTPLRTTDVFVSRAVHVGQDPDVTALSDRIGVAADKLARTDALTRMALAAVADLRDAGVPFVDGGVVVGHAFATMETNAAFQAGIRKRGAASAEPRRFPYTSPNAVCGDVSVAFGLRGPSFAVGGGVHGGLEALVVASDLVRSGDAPCVVVVAVDEVGSGLTPVADAWFGSSGNLPSGAVAVVVSRVATSGARPLLAGRVGTFARDATPESASLAPGHLALLPLVRERGTRTLRSRGRGGLGAEVVLGDVVTP